MPLTSTVAALLEGCRPALPFVARKTTLDVLMYCLLEADQQQGTVEATDLQTTFCGPLAAVGTQGPERFLVPIHAFVDLLTHCTPTSPARLAHTRTGKCQLQTDEGTYTLPSMDADLFPARPHVTDQDSGWTIETSTLLSGLTAVGYACGTDPTRPIFLGVELVGTSAGLALTATDGIRLAHTFLPVPALGDWSCVVPSPTVPLLQRWLRHTPEAALTLRLTATYLALTSGATTVIASLSAVPFVTWARILPTRPATQVTVDRTALLGGLRRGMTLAPASSKPRVLLGCTAGALLLETSFVDDCVARETLPLAWQGEPKHTCLNGTLLSEAIEQLTSPTDQVTLEFRTPIDALILYADAPEHTFALLAPFPDTGPPQRRAPTQEGAEEDVRRDDILPPPPVLVGDLEPADD
jgi:DNA polymerase III sliding clamp (beta) subunit (PCNA family)